MKEKIKLFTLDYVEYNEGRVTNLITGLQDIVNGYKDIDLLYEVEQDNIVFYREETDNEYAERIVQENEFLRKREIEQLNKLKAKYER